MADLCCCMAETNISSGWRKIALRWCVGFCHTATQVQSNHCQTEQLVFSLSLLPVACSVSLNYAGLDTLRYSALPASWQGPLTLSSFKRPEPAVWIHTSFLVVIVNLFPFGLLWHWFTNFPIDWFTDCLLSEFPGGQLCAAATWVCASFVPPLPLEKPPWPSPDLVVINILWSFQICRWSPWLPF